MKTLEHQLADYGDYQKELHGPIAAAAIMDSATNDYQEAPRSRSGLLVAVVAAVAVLLVVLIPWLLRADSSPPVISPLPPVTTVPETPVTTVPETPPVTTVPETPVTALPDLDVEDLSIDWVRIDDLGGTDLTGLGYVRSVAYVDSHFVIPSEYCDETACDWLASDDGVGWVREPMAIAPPAIGQFVSWVDATELWLFQQTGWKREGDPSRDTPPSVLEMHRNDGSRWFETSQSLPEDVRLYYQNRVVAREELRRVSVGGEFGIGGSWSPVFSGTQSVIPMNGSPAGDNLAGDNGYWLSVGEGDRYTNIPPSAIGAAQYPVVPAGFLNGVLYGIVFDEKQQASSIWTLEGGDTWKRLETDTELLTLVNDFDIVNERAFLNDPGVVMADGGRRPSGTVWTSEDLVSWTETEGLMAGARVSATEFGWISESGTVSNDGIRWRGIDPPFAGESFTASYANGLFFVIGNDGFEATSVWIGRPTNE